MNFHCAYLKLVAYKIKLTSIQNMSCAYLNKLELKCFLEYEFGNALCLALHVCLKITHISIV